MGLFDDFLKARRQKQALGARGNPGAAAGHPRLPPGQVETKKWPVLHVGPVPRFDEASWDFRVFGEVDSPLRLSWRDFAALPRVRTRSDFHCVTRWSRLENEWEGVPFSEIERRAGIRPEARFVIFHCEGGYTANIRIEDARREGVILAVRHDGSPLSPEHGGPLRAIVPHLYGWKSAKWLRGVEFRREDAPGYWETRGYHNIADPWKEQRFSGD
jgi:DMSO/TMAO reductase YedYZ molybdopterin-dependent catalytic subunit